MSNVVSFLRAKGLPEMGFGVDVILRGFATARRSRDDLRWMKENAELLRILAASRTPVPVDTLEDCYGAFLRDAPKTLAFFPQYYRFFLHMVCDLRDLGLSGPEPAALMQIALKSGAPQAETSDVLRAESQWLARRAGLARDDDARQLLGRLARLVADPARFALPNRKVGYELTHIAFYLSDYGKTPGAAPEGLDTSLRYVGILAWMEQNFDLLAECCLALRFIGAPVPDLWHARLAQVLPSFHFAPYNGEVGQDGYHCWLMVLWSQLDETPMALNRPFPAGGFGVSAPVGTHGALRTLSRHLMTSEAGSLHDWDSARATSLLTMDEEEAAIVQTAATFPDFEAFFSAFSRAGLRACVA